MQALTGERAGTRTALNALEEMFRGTGQQQRRGNAGQAAPMTVVLLDEMDLLVTRNQTVRLGPLLARCLCHCNMRTQHHLGLAPLSKYLIWLIKSLAAFSQSIAA